YGGTSSRLALLSARCREGRAPHLLIAVDQALRDRYRAFTTGQLAEQACSPSADLRIRVGGTHDQEGDRRRPDAHQGPEHRSALGGSLHRIPCAPPLAA